MCSVRSHAARCMAAHPVGVLRTRTCGAWPATHTHICVSVRSGAAHYTRCECAAHLAHVRAARFARDVFALRARTAHIYSVRARCRTRIHGVARCANYIYVLRGRSAALPCGDTRAELRVLYYICHAAMVIALHSMVGACPATPALLMLMMLLYCQ